ncbi:hypothetical protein GGI00_004039 [Coemansia sp. RSA 2681]|nr:hypothetical protein GGI00_004039 [Coemansia sp. RSA 2681]KAJ2437643.1 hypothetical protein GGF42_008554 [Coemansia sp. RSA 2424]KAJ2444027.1 hypothetical protein GGF42_006442 [Coemansia sp. RSA 2424]KAJ2509230.1 hypothetical protein IWW47_000120 [Coemansia sp. RSA 2052]
MVKTNAPELKSYMDKKLLLKLNCDRAVAGVLRGYDPFMNVHLADAYEVISPEERESLGVVVIRGNSIVSMEALEHIDN